MTETSPGATSPDERKKRYKQSLNLPRTSFPMRANLAVQEPRSQQRWQQENLYETVLEARRDGEPFVFHDGPPYANGDIHVGHLLNKVLKDMVVRSRSLMGQRCPYIPGWDCHGLPIEHRVMAALVESGKVERLNELDDDARRMAVRRECRRYAEKYQGIQATQMQRLLTLADYRHPYMTMTPEYEREVLEVLAALVDQGLVYRDLKPVHWSIANETALAEAELEYMDREDPSIYVFFDAEEPDAVRRAFGLEPGDAGAEDAPVSLLIWTTTPWTLPANLLIAVHPASEYSLVEVGGMQAVIASRLVDAVAAAGGATARTLARAPGSALLGLTYRHPFVERSGRVVGADYVTLEDGTGLVHTAPGHGQEDFATGLAEGTEIYSPVRADGTFDDSVPDWLRGVSVWTANDLIVARLRDSGHLLASIPLRHSYPHDWRSKTPVIFRCTEQWFVAVDRPASDWGASLRTLALAAAGGEIEFVPAWGVKRLSGMLASRPDWCISRQRAWGLPIPAFRRPDGGIFMTTASVRAVADTFGRLGSDAWFQQSPAELLAGYDPAADPDAPEGLDPGSLEKLQDILDVWFESGSSWHAAMRRRGQQLPIDLYLEGSDQHRGWFQLALLTGLGATGRSPFRTLLTHGFIVDKNGGKMSKSLGNALEVEELLQHFGADVCRWWVSSLAFENDIKVDLEFFERAGDSYRKVRNTLRFLLSNLSDFGPAAAVDLATLDPTSLDAWAVAAAADLRRQVLDAYRRFEFRQAHLLLFDFCNESLSAFYLDALKDRLYCDRADSPRRRSAQSVLRHLAEMLATLLAPILPHTADEAWRALHGEQSCVHVETPPAAGGSSPDPGWSRVLELRDAALKALEDSPVENSLDAGVVLPDADGTLARFAAELPDALGVSRVRLADGDAAVEVLDLRQEPRCERSWRRDETVKQRSDGGWLSDRDAAVVGVA